MALDFLAGLGASPGWFSKSMKPCVMALRLESPPQGTRKNHGNTVHGRAVPKVDFGMEAAVNLILGTEK